MPTGTVRFWAAARDAAGTSEATYDASTLDQALQAIRRHYGDALSGVLDRCSFLVDEAPVGGRDHATIELSDGGTIEVLPPFAGG